MSSKNVAKLMEIRGLSEIEVRTELALKKALKDNINDYLDEKNEWISFDELLKVSGLYNFNKGGEITERGLKIMLARMRDQNEIFKSDNSGYWWTTITSDAKSIPVTAIPAEWKPSKKIDKVNGNGGLGVRGKRATSADKFYNTVLNARLRSDRVPEKTLNMARIEYANFLAIQFGNKASIESISDLLKAGELIRFNAENAKPTFIGLSEEDEKELDNLNLEEEDEKELDNLNLEEEEDLDDLLLKAALVENDDNEEVNSSDED